jgi:hypothetical protein
MCFILFGAYPNHMQIQIIVNNNLREKGIKKRKTEKRNTAARIRTNVRVRRFNAGLLARSQFASGRFCDRPTRSRFSVVFLGPRAIAELVPKFHVALHASHAALPMVTLNISPCSNVTLTFDFGLDHPGALYRDEPAPRRTGRQTVGRNVT